MANRILPGKKLKTLAAGIILLVVARILGIDGDIQRQITLLLATYLLGQGLADGLSGGKTSHSKD